ncbi:MAG: hypothetical protein GY765_20055, partial [bacterium]|nr:hypothetical protein [bacterium]
RFTAYPDRIVKELKVEDIHGNDSWVAFNFTDKRFPFDVVTSIATRGNELYVGTKAGLQVYSGFLSTGLDEIKHLYTYSGRRKTGLSEVLKTGFPEKDPGLLMVRFASGCIENRGTSFKPCSKPGLLDRRLRVDNDFWRWTEGSGGSLTGKYKDHTGKLISKKITLRQGRFPHDRITDIAIWKDRAFTICLDGWISVYPDETLKIGPKVKNFFFKDSNLRNFIPVEKDIFMDGVKIPRGLYATDGSRVMRFSHNSWVDLSGGAIKNALLEYRANPPIFNRKSLRLLKPEGKQKFVFEQCSTSGKWHKLPWESGRVQIDNWKELVEAGGKLWAATPGGLCGFSRDKSGRAVLDPDSMILIREPVGLQITDL